MAEIVGDLALGPELTKTESTANLLHEESTVDEETALPPTENPSLTTLPDAGNGLPSVVAMDSNKCPPEHPPGQAQVPSLTSSSDTNGASNNITEVQEVEKLEF